MVDAKKLEELKKAQKAMSKALKKYGANSQQFDKARNKYNAIMETT